MLINYGSQRASKDYKEGSEITLFVLRCQKEEYRFNDMVRGEMDFKEDVEDWIILKITFPPITRGCYR